MTLKEFLDLAVEYGVSKLKCDNFEVEFKQQPKQIPFNDIVPEKQEISDEDMLFYSVAEPIKK